MTDTAPDEGFPTGGQSDPAQPDRSGTGTGVAGTPEGRPTIAERVEGWGPGPHPDGAALSPEQLGRLQEHDEPVAQGDFGGMLSGDLGNAEVGDEADAPQTREPDTSLGHEGGARYDAYEQEVRPD